jgi:hypothetical protein
VATKLVVAAVFVLAAAAAGDALRGVGVEERSREARIAPARVETTALRRGRAAQYVGAGAFLRKRVLRSGEEYLGAEAIERAFPVRAEGPLDISKIAVAPDGTLVLAIYRFPPRGEAQGGLELWRGRRLVGSFPVPPGYFGGGLAFNRDGSLVATFSYDGQLRGVFDRQGHRVSGLPESFLSVD